MSAKFIGASSAQAVAASIVVDVPSLAGLQKGDLLFLFLAVQGFSGVVLGAPASWSVEPGPQTAGDQVLFTALHYVGEDEEPETYTFTYSASKPMIAFVAAYRGVPQDVLFDPVNYPFGYYAPSGSLGTPHVQTAVSSISTLGTSTVDVPYSRALVYLGGSNASLAPLLSDVQPLIAMRAKLETSKLSGMLCDVLEPAVLASTPTYSAASSVVLSGSIALVRVLEALVPKNDTIDTYKAKIMRHLLPPPYDKRYSSVMGQLLTVAGGGDNDIGGLMGVADFLPDEQ